MNDETWSVLCDELEQRVKKLSADVKVLRFHDRLLTTRGDRGRFIARLWLSDDGATCYVCNRSGAALSGNEYSHSFALAKDGSLDEIAHELVRNT